MWYITQKENGDVWSWKNVLPELAQWAGRRGWHFPPPLSSGRHLSSVQHTQWCPWADDGRIPGYLEWQEMKQHTTMIIVQKPHRISLIKLFIQHFNVQLCSKHTLMPHYVIDNLLPTRWRRAWPAALTHIMSKHHALAAGDGKIINCWLLSQVENSEYRTSIIYRLLNPTRNSHLTGL